MELEITLTMNEHEWALIREALQDLSAKKADAFCQAMESFDDDPTDKKWELRALQNDHNAISGLLTTLHFEREIAHKEYIYDHHISHKM